jgi:hypothetical protein
MLRGQSTTTKRCLGIGPVIQGAFVIGISHLTLPAALRVAEILYAEDFDRSGVVPPGLAPGTLPCGIRMLWRSSF